MTTTLAVCDDRSLSQLALGLTGSEILRISGEIRSLAEAGRDICNLTVGDFSPKEFRIPRVLEGLIAKELRQAVIRFYADVLGLTYPIESTLIAGGARPIIFAAYASVVDPGDKVVYPIPSWNNNHYTYLMRGQPVEVTVGPETNFLPTTELLRPHVRDARLICICTPANPTGTVMARDEVERIARLVVEENERRASAGERALLLLWDQVYWMLTFGGNKHYPPTQLVPEVTPYTIYVDGVSKAFAATGLRVGWTLAPPPIAARMRDILGHLGAWAPRPEQIAVAKFLGMRGAIDEFHDTMIRELQLRLDLLYERLDAMRRDGLPVRAIAPQGAIYLSVQFDLVGRGAITTNEQIRRRLLDDAGFAVVPFQAFGLPQESGWFRLSVGAVSPRQIEAGLARVRNVLARYA